MDWADIENPKKERKILLRAIRKDRFDAKLYFRLAAVYENVKILKKAIWYGRIALRFQPDNTEFLEFMAFVCSKNGDVPLAIKYWEILTKIDPADSYYWAELENMQGCLPYWLEQHQSN